MEEMSGGLDVCGGRGVWRRRQVSSSAWVKVGVLGCSEGGGRASMYCRSGSERRKAALSMATREAGGRVLR